MLEITRFNFHRMLNAVLIAALLGMSGVMYVSAHGGDVTLIHACVNNRSGAVRVVSPTTTCDASRETALDWNIRGPKGDKGDTGDVGPMGLQGPAGEAAVHYEHVSPELNIPPGADWYAAAECDPGDQLVTWGYDAGGYPLGILSSEPDLIMGFGMPSSWAWKIRFFNSEATNVRVIVRVICADTFTWP